MSADCRCELQLQLLYNLEMINYIFLFFCNEKWNCLLSAREREKRLIVSFLWNLMKKKLTCCLLAQFFYFVTAKCVRLEERKKQYEKDAAFLIKELKRKPNQFAFVFFFF